MMLTQPELKKLLSYDPETGVFTWLVGQLAGKIAGTESHGYVKIKIATRLYYAHRLAWMCVHGAMPSAQIDHINCIRGDNRICNLRECTVTQNNFNAGLRRDNTSGLKGASWNKQNSRWEAKISINGKTKRIGNFLTAELAAAAYQAKAREVHGEFHRDTRNK